MTKLLPLIVATMFLVTAFPASADEPLTYPGQNFLDWAKRTAAVGDYRTISEVKILSPKHIEVYITKLAYSIQNENQWKSTGTFYAMAYADICRCQEFSRPEQFTQSCPRQKEAPIDFCQPVYAEVLYNDLVLIKATYPAKLGARAR